MKKLTTFISFIALLMVVPVIYATPSIKGLRIYGTQNKLRLVFDVTDQVKHKVFTLKNPKRLVVDVRAAYFENKTLVLPKKVKFVQNIRLSSPNGGLLRLVLDLNEAVTKKIFWLPLNENLEYRLVLDLKCKYGCYETDNSDDTFSRSTSRTTRHSNSGRVSATLTPQQASYITGRRNVSSRASNYSKRPIQRRVVKIYSSGSKRGTIPSSSEKPIQKIAAKTHSRSKIYTISSSRRPIQRRTTRTYSGSNKHNTAIHSKKFVKNSSVAKTRRTAKKRPVIKRPLAAYRIASYTQTTPPNQTYSTKRQVQRHKTVKYRKLPRRITSRKFRKTRVTTNTRAAAAARLALGTGAWPDLRTVRGRDLIIVVDAGHGGKDSGAVGLRGTKEKDIVLSIAHKLGRMIDMQVGMKSVLTRRRDVFISLRGRVRKARSVNADLFVSIHADAAYNRRAKGGSVYTLSRRGASSAKARALAARENSSGLVGGIHVSKRRQPLLAKVLVDMSLSATIGASRRAAKKVLNKMYHVGNIHKRSVQYAGFAVLKAPDIPSMLVETAFLSNPKEEMKLRTSAFQTEIAEAIFSGILEYFRNRPPAGTKIAQAMRLSRN